MLLTWVPRSVSVSAEYVLANSHQRHRGALVVTVGVKGFRQEIIFTGSKAQFPGLSSHHNGSKVICELPWITSIALKNLGTRNNLVFCWKIAKGDVIGISFLSSVVCLTFLCHASSYQATVEEPGSIVISIFNEACGTVKTAWFTTWFSKEAVPLPQANLPVSQYSMLLKKELTLWACQEKLHGESWRQRLKMSLRSVKGQSTGRRRSYFVCCVMRTLYIDLHEGRTNTWRIT